MLRIEKKAASSHKMLQRIISVVAAFLISGIFIWLCGYNPLEFYKAMFTGPFLNAYYRGQTIVKMIPLVVMGLGVAVCFKMNFINIGAEGQFCMGAIGATWIALFCPNLPVWVQWTLMFVVGFAFGGLWALIAGALKAKWHVSDTLVTLMLNYVGIKIVSYLQYGAWKDPKSWGYPKIANYPTELQLPNVLGAQCGWIIALVLVAIVWVLLKKTKLGYEISIMGDTEPTARYAGIDTKKLLIIVSVIGGGLCGLAGVIKASGTEHTLSDTMSGGLGYTAIVVAYMAQMSPLGIVLVSFLMSVLLQGGAYMQIALQIPATAADVVQGIILLFVLGSEFFSTYRFVFIHSRRKAE